MIDWGLLAGLWFLVAMAYPIHCSCHPCEECDPCTTIASYQIEVEGTANDSCTECASLDGVYILSQTDFNPCTYAVTFEPVLCEGFSGFAGISRWILELGANLAIQTAGGNQYASFTYSNNTWPRDCSDPPWTASFSGTEPIANVCDWSGVTITVTPI